MNNSLHNVQKRLDNAKLLAFFAIMMTLFIPELSLAQVPSLTTGTVGVPGVDDNSSVMKTIIMIIAFIVFILVIANFGFGLSDTMASFFRQLNDARKEGEWAPLLRFVGLAFAILAIVFLLIGYINKHVIDVANGIT